MICKRIQSFKMAVCQLSSSQIVDFPIPFWGSFNDFKFIYYVLHLRLADSIFNCYYIRVYVSILTTYYYLRLQSCRKILLPDPENGWEIFLDIPGELRYAASIYLSASIFEVDKNLIIVYHLFIRNVLGLHSNETLRLIVQHICVFQVWFMLFILH